MKKFTWIVFFVLVLGVIFIMQSSVAVYADEVPRMSKDELKGLLDNSDVIILDVRRGKDWDASEYKIKGATQEKGTGSSWADKYPKDKTIVLYCA